MPQNCTEGGIEINRCLNANKSGFEIELGPGKLQLSVLMPKTKAPINGLGIDDFIVRRKDNSGIPRELVSSLFKSGSLSLRKVKRCSVLFRK